MLTRRPENLAADSKAQVSLGVSQERPEVSRKNISPPSGELGTLNLSSSTFFWQTGPRVWGFLIEYHYISQGYSIMSTSSLCTIPLL